MIRSPRLWIALGVLVVVAYGVWSGHRQGLNQWPWDEQGNLLIGPPEFSVLNTAGDIQPVAIEDYAAYAAPEIDWARYLPPHICDVEPDVVAVLVRQPGDPVLTVVPCP